MDTEQVDALATAADDGVEFDGFAASTEGDGYVLATTAGSKTLIGEEDLPETAADYADYVTNWYFWHATAPQAENRWTYLRWLERADELAVPERYGTLTGDADWSESETDRSESETDRSEGGADSDDAGVVRTWGELRVTVTADADGDRSYELRHVEDADTPDSKLTDYEDPLDAREIAKHDDSGRYRPLKTAPSLQSGWRFADLGPADLVDAVDFFYPASVANWYREREGDLDVTHWRETVERQTGIYGVVQTWDRGDGHEHVDWVAEACCDDSQCLKRREWEYDEETDLSVDGGASGTPGKHGGDTAGGGDGEFPCREPCSLVIAAARQWTKLEGEQSRTYEFELTPSEKEQVEEIIGAVADGRAGNIREADIYDGANRYRARFLRAKRFDDEGNLSGTPTEPDETDAGSGEGNSDEPADADAEDDEKHDD
jgi:hypothetical protein